VERTAAYSKRDAVPERRTLGARLARGIARFVAADLDEEPQAFLTVRSILFGCVAVTSLTLVGYSFFEPSDGLVIVANAVALGAYGVALVCVTLDHRLGATVTCLAVATAQILLCSMLLGTCTGFFLYYLAAGQVMYVVFTEREVWWRWGYLGVAAAAFAFCEVEIRNWEPHYEVSTRVTRIVFSANAIVTASVVLLLAAIAHGRARAAQSAARDAAVRAEYLANTDALTGLANRRPVTEQLSRLSADDASRYCLAVGDLDGFKELNDTFGHSCGDAVLTAVGLALRASVRTTDLVGRWGGEEFIFVLPDCGLKEAEALAERVRSVVERLVVDCAGHSHTTTISIGVADSAPGVPGFRVLKRADDAMYDAKAAGRNVIRTRAHEGPSRGSNPDDVSTRSLRIRGTDK
jgi:diguanylate cyclase (GGDEF)-like protein